MDYLSQFDHRFGAVGRGRVSQGERQIDHGYEQVQRLIDGDNSWLMETGKPLCEELYVKMRAQLLKPRVVVDYTRKAFTYEPGNVRVTFDKDVLRVPL